MSTTTSSSICTLNYAGKINDTFSWTTGVTLLHVSRIGDDLDGDFAEVYVGFNAGNFSFKQWYADDFFDVGVSSACTPKPTTRHRSATTSRSPSTLGYAWGDCWDD